VSHQSPRAAQPYRAVWRCGLLVVALRSDPWFVGNPLGGAGALRSTASDMLKYLKANMRPEGQPPAHAHRESHQVLFKEDEYTTIGMNWIHLQSLKLQQPLIWHNGGTGGFRSFLGFTEEGRFGALILSNTSDDVDQLAIALLSDLTGKPAQPDQN
jgi:CubicO group peptidase (beta-lactamase class C family)